MSRTTIKASPAALDERTRQAYEYLKCRADPVYFIDTYVRINHKARGVIPFRLWRWQADLIDTIHREREVIILKARQLGVSEIAVAYALWLVRFHASKTVLFLSIGEKDAKDLLARAKLAYAHLPAFLQCGTPVSIDTTVISEDNTERFQIDHLDGQQLPHPSVIRSLPATEHAGRSSSASLLVLDEWAHQPHDQEIWTAAHGTVSSSGGKVLGISTARGMGNVFHEMWTKAEAGVNTFRPVFLPWSMHPERDAAWYAHERANKSLLALHQEYPTTAAEAFVQTGHPLYDADMLARHEQRIRQANLPALVLPDAPLAATHGLTVWATPVDELRDATGTITERHHEYLIGADVAEGLDHGDYDAAVVVDRQTGQEVAELHGHWSPEVFAELLNWLGRRYHHALLAVERNNHGHAVLLALASIQHYPALYHHRDPLLPGKPPEARVGWPTTSVTKPLMLDALGKGLRDATYCSWSLPFLAEAAIFAVQKDGGMGAPSGYFDDRVMSRAIACYLLFQPSRTAGTALTQLRARAEAQQQGLR